MDAGNVTVYSLWDVSSIHDWLRVCSTILILLTITVGVFGNVLVCLAVYYASNLRTATNALIINLAVADLFNCCVCSPIRLVIIYIDMLQPLHFAWVCYLHEFMLALGGCVQLITLTCISYERYQAIAHPFEKVQRIFRIKICLVSSWILGLIVAVVAMTCFDFSPLVLHCLSRRYVSDLYTYNFGLYITVPLTFVAVSIIIIMYCRIIHFVKRHVENTKSAFQKKSKIHPAKEALNEGNITRIHIDQTSKQLTIDRASPQVQVNDSKNLNTSATGKLVKQPHVFNITNVAESQLNEKPSTSSTRARNNDRYQTLSPDLPKRIVLSKSKTSFRAVATVAGLLRPQRNVPHEPSNNDGNYSIDATTNMEAGGGEKYMPFADKNVLLTPALQCKNNTESYNSLNEKSSRKMLKHKVTNLPDDQVKSQESLHSSVIHSTVDETDRDLEVSQNDSAGDLKMELPKATDMALKFSKQDNETPAFLEDELRVSPQQGENKNEKSITPHSEERIIKICDMDGEQQQVVVQNKDICGDICVMNPQNKERGKRRMEAKTAKKAAIVIGTFLFCWLPLPITIIVCHDWLTVVAMYDLFLVTLCVASVSAALNPIVYGFVNRQFRTQYTKIFKRCKLKSN